MVTSLIVSFIVYKVFVFFKKKHVKTSVCEETNHKTHHQENK